jgi:hypothetical protein
VNIIRSFYSVLLNTTSRSSRRLTKAMMRPLGSRWNMSRLRGCPGTNSTSASSALSSTGGAALARTHQPAGLFGDDIAQAGSTPIFADIGVGQPVRQTHCGRILLGRQHLHAEQLPAGHALHPTAGDAILRVQMLAVVIFIFIVQLAGNCDSAVNIGPPVNHLDEA